MSPIKTALVAVSTCHISCNTDTHRIGTQGAAELEVGQDFGVFKVLKSGIGLVSEVYIGISSTGLDNAHERKRNSVRVG